MLTHYIPAIVFTFTSPIILFVYVIAEGSLMRLMVSLSTSTMQQLTVQGLGEETYGSSLGKGGGSKPSTLNKEVILPGPGLYRVPVNNWPHFCTSTKPHRSPPRSVANTARLHAKVASFPRSPRLGTRLGEG